MKKIILMSLFITMIITGCGESDAKTSAQPGTEQQSENKSAENDSVENEDGDTLQEKEAAEDNSHIVQGAGTDDKAARDKNEDSDGKDSSDRKKDSAQKADSDSKDDPNQKADMEMTPENEGEELVLASEDWGLGFGESGTQPTGNASAADLARYDAYYVGDDSEKVIYLTFDCGYENGNTEPILDALKKHSAPATFFVVGHFLESAPDLAKRMVEEGHTVGNHTYHHLDMPTISDKETFQKEMDDVADLFYEVTGTELSLYYRPPQGKCNTQNLKMAQELGYSTIFWSLAYVDWNQDNQPTHQEAFDKLTTRIHPGAIVLLHNTSQTNGEILDELLTRWEEMGYCFKPLSELVEK